MPPAATTARGRGAPTPRFGAPPGPARRTRSRSLSFVPLAQASRAGREEGMDDITLPAGHGLAVHAGETRLAQAPAEAARPVEAVHAAPQVPVEGSVAGGHPASRDDHAPAHR